MNREELHEFLVKKLGLVAEPAANNISRTYFFERVELNPQRSTRVFRVIFGANGEPNRIQLCASSDNNNTVLISQPLDAQTLEKFAFQEIKSITERLRTMRPETITNADS